MSDIKKDSQRSLIVKIRDPENPVEGKAKTALEVAAASAAFSVGASISFASKVVLTDAEVSPHVPAVVAGSAGSTTADSPGDDAPNVLQPQTVLISKMLTMVPERVTGWTALLELPLPGHHGANSFSTSMMLRRSSGSESGRTPTGPSDVVLADPATTTNFMSSASLTLSSRDVFVKPDGTVVYKDKEPAGNATWDGDKRLLTWTPATPASQSSGRRVTVAGDSSGVARSALQAIFKSIACRCLLPPRRKQSMMALRERTPTPPSDQPPLVRPANATTPSPPSKRVGRVVITIRDADQQEPHVLHVDLELSA